MEWPVIHGRGRVSLDADALVVVTGRRTRRFPLAATTLRLARWCYGEANAVGAALVATAGDVTASIAGAHTPGGVVFEGSVERPTAIVAPEALAALHAALAPRIAYRPVEAGEDARFELRARNAATARAMLPFAVMVTAVFVLKAVETAARLPWLVGVAFAVAAAVAGLVRWVLRRTAPLVLAVDGDRVELRGPGGVLAGRRGELRAEIGHVAVFLGAMTARYPAIAIVVGGRRLVLHSAEAGAPGRALHGQAFLLPPDRLARLRALLRLT